MKNFTEELGKYLNTPIENRNHEEGAKLLLQITRNQIQYRNLSVNPARHAKYIERELQKYYKVRIINITHSEVEAMQAEVDNIAAKHLSFETDNQKNFQKGIRSDHEQLPVEIQALYKENLGIMQKMREVHLQLRNLSTEGTSCPDNDRYPFLKELIELDKRYHANWETYDHFVVGSSEIPAPTPTAVEQKIIRQINLNVGKFKKNPTPSLKEKIQSLYNDLSIKPEKITSTLSELGII